MTLTHNPFYDQALAQNQAQTEERAMTEAKIGRILPGRVRRSYTNAERVMVHNYAVKHGATAAAEHFGITRRAVWGLTKTVRDQARRKRGTDALEAAKKPRKRVRQGEAPIVAKMKRIRELEAENEALKERLRHFILEREGLL